MRRAPIRSAGGMISEFGRMPDRREFLRWSLLTSGAVLSGDAFSSPPLVQHAGVRAEPSKKKLATLGFVDEAPVPLGRVFGTELDGRLYTDLEELTPEILIIPARSFYIRTRASDLLATQDMSSIQINGLVHRPSALPLQELSRSAKPMGAHLIECAGNARIIHFGLMSVAEWSGIPIADVLDNFQKKPEATRVLVSGFDEYRRASNSSLPGASWVFRSEELKSANAFLATAMNGEPLSADHGAPIRLVVPGWYGCTCIKWVKQITLLDDSAEATLQMREYASRTLQNGVPPLARDFQPAVIDQAAMPIRVEKWSYGDRIVYRVVGILWGGSSPVKKLEIQFNPDLDYGTVDTVHQKGNDPWSFWSHDWFPGKVGRYSIRVRVKEPHVRTRRLDEGFYIRSVEVKEV